MDCDVTVSYNNSLVKQEPLLLNDGNSDDEINKKIETSSKKPRKKKKTPYKEYRCRFCDKFYRNKTHFERHERGHTGERPFQCSVCGFAFKSLNNLIEHQRRHLGEKPDRQCMPNTRKYAVHKCETCPKTFTSRGSLRRHMDAHSTVPNYSCPNCDRKFFHASTLNRHLLVESGIKNHACDFCDKKFVDKSYLRKHISNHIGLKKFLCSECGRLFIQSNGLKKHKCHETRSIEEEGKLSENIPFKGDLEVENIESYHTNETEIREENSPKLMKKRKVNVKKEYLNNRHKKVKQKHKNTCRNANEELCVDQTLTAHEDQIPGDNSHMNDFDSEDYNHEEEHVYIDTVNDNDDVSTDEYNANCVDDSACIGENDIVSTASCKVSSDYRQHDLLNTEETYGDKSNDLSDEDMKDVKENVVKQESVLDTASVLTIGRDKECFDDACVIVNGSDTAGSDVFYSKPLLPVLVKSEEESNTTTLNTSEPESPHDTCTFYAISEHGTEETKGEDTPLVRDNDMNFDITEVDIQLVEDETDSSHRINGRHESHDNLSRRLEQSKLLWKNQPDQIKSNNGKVIVKNDREINLPQNDVTDKTKKIIIPELENLVSDRGEINIIDPEDKNDKPAEIVKPPKRLVCRHCKEEFVVRREYLQHLRANHFYLKCDKCGVEKRRWRECHWDEHKCQICEDCGRVFQSSKTLKNHRKLLHACTSCHKAFCTMNSLKIHEINEMCKVMFSCQQCDKTFSTQHMLEKHRRCSHDKHKGKAYRCRICGFGYKTLSSLHKHTMMHNGKHVCKHCKKKCYDLQRLQLHESKCVKSLNVVDIRNNDTVTKESDSNLNSDDEIRCITKPFNMSSTIDNITDVSDVLLMGSVTGTTHPESDADEDLDLPDIDVLTSDDEECVAGTMSSRVCETTVESGAHHNDRSGIHVGLDYPGEIDTVSSMTHRTKTEHFAAIINGKIKRETSCDNDIVETSAKKLVVSTNLFGKDVFHRNDGSLKYLKKVDCSELGADAIDYLKHYGVPYNQNGEDSMSSDGDNISRVKDVSEMSKSMVSLETEEVTYDDESDSGSDSGSDSDTDSDGYEECTTEEVKAMISTMQP